MAPYDPEQVEPARLNATIEDAGICLCCVRFTCDRMERKFKIPNAAVAGRIKELAVSVEGGQTYLVVKFLEPPDSASVCELEHAAHSAAHRIEVLAGGGGRTDRAGKRNVDRSPELDGLIGESELIGSVAKNILATFHSSDELVDAITSCMVSEFLQQIPPE